MTGQTRARLAASAACLALLAASCGGEAGDTAGGVDAAANGGDASEGAGTATDSAGDGAPDAPDDDSEPPGDTTDGDTTDGDADPTDASTDTGEGGADAADAEGAEGAEGADTGPAPNIFDDPRGGVFDEFQSTFDRGDHPFLQLDAFCHAHDPAPDRMSTDTGIEADSISLVHLRTRLEDLADMGFAVPVGDVTEMFDTFTAVVNEQCGGVRGRMIELRTIDLDVLGATVDEDRNAACIQAIEDFKGVILLNSTGFGGSANLCIAEEHRTAFVSTQGQSEEYMRRGEDRLVSIAPTLEQSLRWLALDLVQRGALEGSTVGVAASDSPGELESVESGLVETLRASGVNVAVFDVIGCSGGSVCTVGAVESVQRMREAGIDVFFNVLNVLSAPGYILEMSNQGFKPGDVQFYASNFNAQSVEIVASKIVAFGGEAAGNLYNGALIIDGADTGAYRLEGYEPRAFSEMCNETYRANNISGASHQSTDLETGLTAYGMTTVVCSILRTALRAIYDSGDNPTRAEVHTALASLGPIDTDGMLPSTLRPGKTQALNVIHTLRFEYPCTKPHPFGKENICIYPVDDYRPGPR